MQQSSSSSSSKQGQEKIRIRLWTNHVKYTVTDAPLAVPSKLGRYGLSEVVNHLLGSEDEPQPFDFILNGHLIRGSLKKYLAEQRVSTEEVVAIEYIPAVSLSGESDTVEVPAWVGCLDSRVEGLTIAGCYDGKIQIIDTTTMAVTAAVMAHDEPIRSVITWRMHPQKIAANQGGVFMATASKDNTVKVWSIQDALKEPHMVPLGILKGHINSVESMDLWENAVSSGRDGDGQRVLLSGDWSGNIFGWNIGSLLNEDNTMQGKQQQQQHDDGRKNKKQKGDKGGAVVVAEGTTMSVNGRELKPAFTIRAHAQSVSGIQTRGINGTGGSTNSSPRMFTCSWDHSLKEWDLERQDCIASFASSKVFCSLDYSAEAGLVVTSHPDGRVRLWDPRKKDEVGITGGADVMLGNGQTQIGTFYSGKETHWIAQAKFQPQSNHVFASCDYDGVVRVWDTRAANVPLGSTSAHEGKALCIDWLVSSTTTNDECTSRVLSGGSDCVVRASSVV